MALTIDELKQLLEHEDFRYFMDPRRPALLLGTAGLHGKYQFMIILELEGQFVQFRTMGYLHCPADHPHLTEVLKVLGAMNYRKRLAKFGWDPADGEIMVYADMWLMDNKVTQPQFNRLLHNYLPCVDLGCHRISQTLQTGKDPGEEDPEKSVADLLADGGRNLPPAIRELLKKLREGKGPDAPAKPPTFDRI